jgi:hypothetical protein
MTPTRTPRSMTDDSITDELPPAEKLPRRSAPPPKEILDELPESLRRGATESEIAGTRELLGGHRGKVVRPAGPGSWFVMLDNGVEVVLPANTLYLAGAEVPRPEYEASDELVRGWTELIAGRSGRVISKAGEGSYHVELEGGARVVLPEAALGLAGCALHE